MTTHSRAFNKEAKANGSVKTCLVPALAWKVYTQTHTHNTHMLEKLYIACMRFRRKKTVESFLMSLEVWTQTPIWTRNQQKKKSFYHSCTHRNVTSRRDHDFIANDVNKCRMLRTSSNAYDNKIPLPAQEHSTEFSLDDVASVLLLLCSHIRCGTGKQKTDKKSRKFIQCKCVKRHVHTYTHIHV